MDLGELLSLSITTFFTMLVVMDPVGLAPVFIALAQGRSPQQQRRLALKATVVAGGIILVFGMFGRALLEHLGISLSAFRVAGGILLFLVALDMVSARQSGTKETPAEEMEAQQRDDISVFPLAIPLIAGPGTLASIMIQANAAHGEPLLLISVFAVTAAVLALCYLALRLSRQIARVLGVTGVNVVTRVLGVLLAALAIQYVADGALDLLRGGLRTG